eukprot:gene6266-4515_t
MQQKAQYQDECQEKTCNAFSCSYMIICPMRNNTYKVQSHNQKYEAIDI